LRLANVPASKEAGPYADKRAELPYYKLSDTCEGELLAAVALGAIGSLVNTTRGREALNQARAKRIVLA
jgi:hypothetical protein